MKDVLVKVVCATDDVTAIEQEITDLLGEGRMLVPGGLKFIVDTETGKMAALVVTAAETAGMTGAVTGWGEKRGSPGRSERSDSDDDDSPECPNCGGAMRKRYRKSDNQPFWGCNSFPDCRGIVNCDGGGRGSSTPRGPKVKAPSQQVDYEDDIPF
jgi:hypothetical protein